MLRVRTFNSKTTSEEKTISNSHCPGFGAEPATRHQWGEEVVRGVKVISAQSGGPLDAVVIINAVWSYQASLLTHWRDWRFEACVTRRKNSWVTILNGSVLTSKTGLINMVPAGTRKPPRATTVARGPVLKIQHNSPVNSI